MQCDAAGRVVLKLKTPWRDGTTHLVMSPLEFMQRLAALVPRPRLHLIRFHGVLAPNAKLRSQVVPAEPPDEARAGLDSERVEPEPEDRHRWGSRISWALLLKRVFEIDSAALPELRRRTEGDRRHPGRAGHRAHPRPPWATGATTTTLTGARPDAARGLTEHWGKKTPPIASASVPVPRDAGRPVSRHRKAAIGPAVMRVNRSCG